MLKSSNKHNPVLKLGRGSKSKFYEARISFKYFLVKTSYKKLLIYYRVLPLNRLKCLRFHECSRDDTNSRTELLRQRAEHHV